MAVAYNCLSIIMYPNDIYRNWHKDIAHFYKWDYIKNIAPDSYDLDVSHFTVNDAFEWDIYDLTKLVRPPEFVNLAVRRDISYALERLAKVRPELSYFLICHDRDEAYDPRRGSYVTGHTHFHVVLIDLDRNFHPESISDWWQCLEFLGMDRYKWCADLPFRDNDGSVIQSGLGGFVPDLDALQHRVERVSYAANMVRYLPHGGRIDKCDYPKSDVVTNDPGMFHRFFYKDEASVAYADMVEMVLFKGKSLEQVFRWARRNNCLQVFDTHQRKLMDMMQHGKDTLKTFHTYEDVEDMISEDQLDDIKRFSDGSDDGTYINL